MGTLELMPTIEVAYFAAAYDLLWRRYKMKRWNSMNPALKTVWSVMMTIAANILADMRGELRYRMQAQPTERSSKKATQAVRGDWAQAAKYLAEGTRYFYSDGFAAQAVAQTEEPDLTVVFEQLPRMADAETPVMWKSDAAVVKDFMVFLNDAEPGSFEAEDAQLILKQLRAMLARAKGQRVEAAS